MGLGINLKFSEKIGQKFFLEDRAFAGLIGLFSGPMRLFWGRLGPAPFASQSHKARAEIAPKRGPV